MSSEEILAAIPHRPPFLFVDEVVERRDRGIVCRKTFAADEWFFSGHYPGNPLVPGVILCEAAMQAGAVLLASCASPDERGVPVAARMNDVRFKRIVRPGETIELDVEWTDHVSNAWYLTATITCQGQLAARLAFTCMLAAGGLE